MLRAPAPFSVFAARRRVLDDGEGGQPVPSCWRMSAHETVNWTLAFLPAASVTVSEYVTSSRWRHARAVAARSLRGAGSRGNGRSSLHVRGMLASFVTATAPAVRPARIRP